MMHQPPGSATMVATATSLAPVLRIGAVSKRFGATTVLEDCSLDVAEGEIVTLLGPSGCGKTTLLRCVAGFLDADGGDVRIDGQDMRPVAVNRRPVGVVFQSYALFPHLTVAKNVGYAMRMQGIARAEADRRIAAALSTVSLSEFGDRYPAQLSGGQQQRVAIARVLVMEPRVLLLDEPFNALDAKLRGTMQVELRQLIKRLGLTAIFVTHDQEEALTMSDRIAVMRAGRIEQAAPPGEIFDYPSTAYVADFVGSSNFWTSTAEDGAIALPDGQTRATELSGAVEVMARPHNLKLAPHGDTPWAGRVSFSRMVGPLIEYHVETPNGSVLQVAAMRQDHARPIDDGAPVSIAVVDPAFCAVYPAR
ncbi:MAG: ABC transporter ATP-binding protein [Pseudomonadota bacterium]